MAPATQLRSAAGCWSLFTSSVALFFVPPCRRCCCSCRPYCDKPVCTFIFFLLSFFPSFFAGMTLGDMCTATKTKAYKSVWIKVFLHSVTDHSPCLCFFLGTADSFCTFFIFILRDRSGKEIDPLQKHSWY